MKIKKDGNDDAPDATLFNFFTQFFWKNIIPDPTYTARKDNGYSLFLG